MSWDQIPSGGKLKPKHFEAHVPEEALDEFKQLLKLSKIGPKTYENLRTDGYFGITREWLQSAKDHWEKKYDWRKCEARLNALPNWTVPIEHDGNSFDIHFMGLFSKKADAPPVDASARMARQISSVSTILEFVGTLELLKSKYKPEDLPFHVIVPSLPGYGYSSGPPLKGDFTTEDCAKMLDNLMVGLGFGGGYIAQGGDIGSFLTRILVATSDHCKTGHINLAVGISPPDEASVEALSQSEKDGWARAVDFGTLGNAYAREHATRPATIGLVLASNPIALLAWVGEKFQQWTDQDPSIDEMLDSATCYWFTESFPRAIYPYRQLLGANPTFFHNNPKYYMKKPFGYSWHPKELAPVPKEWVAKTGNLVWFRAHTEGGHFAAWERPDMFVRDMEEFVGEVWPTVK